MLPLVRHDIERTLRPARVLPLLGLSMVLGYRAVHEPWGPEYAQVQGALTLHGSWLPLAISFFAGVVGGSVAEEQQKGISLTFLARGVTRNQYVRSKLLGSAASGAILTAAAIGGFYILVGISWPAGRVTRWADAWDPGPVPALYAVNPLANDLLAAAMSIVASAVLPGVSVLTGILTSNRYIAMASPLVLMIASLLLEDGPFKALNPMIHLDLWGLYARTIPVALRPYAAFFYWFSFALVITALCQWVFAKKELN